MDAQSTPASKAKKVAVRLAEPPPSSSEDGVVVPTLLAAFPHGMPHKVESLQIKATAIETRAVKRPRAVLEAETDQMRYQSNQPLVNKKALGKYMVGVYSKSKQEVVLYPVEGVMQVSQHIKAVEEEEKRRAQQKAAEQEVKQGNNYEKRKSLVESFGSKKKQRSMQSKEDNRIRADAVMGVGALGSFLAANVQTAVKDAEEAGDAFSAAEASRSQLLPPFHRSAKSPDKVYLVRDVVSEDEWACLEEEADWVLSTHQEGGSDVDATLASMAEQYKLWPGAVGSALREALINPQLEEEQRKERVCAVAYLRHLIAFYHAPPSLHGDASSLADFLGLPEPVTLRLVSTFMEPKPEGGKFVRTKAKTDKLLLYVVVMHLIVGGFKVSATRLALDLRMGVKDLSLLFREAGCTTTKRFRGQSERGSGGGKGGGGQEEVVAELTVPLRFPAPGKRVSSSR